MKLLRSVLPILMLGAIIIFAVENWSPTVPLIILGSQTIALPLALWLLMACGLGVLTIVAIALCLRLINPSLTTASSSQRPGEPPLDARDRDFRDRDSRDRPRVSSPFRERSPSNDQPSSDSGYPQPAEDWEEFSRPRYDWEDRPSRSAQPQGGTSATDFNSSSTSAASQSSRFSPESQFAQESQSWRSPPPRVTEVEFEAEQPSASRFASPSEDWGRYSQAQGTDEWRDRSQSSATDPGYRDDGYRDDDYRDERYQDRDYEYRDREYGDNRYGNRDDSQGDRYYANDYNSNDSGHRDSGNRDSGNSNYANVDESYRQAPDQDGYRYDRYDETDREPYPSQPRTANDRDRNYRNADYRNADYRNADYREDDYPNDDRDYPGYDEQQGYTQDPYTQNAGAYSGFAAGESSQEQFIIDYGDEAALDEFEAALDQSAAGQYRWQRPSSSRGSTNATAAETPSTVDEDLDTLNDWEDWAEDTQAQRDTDQSDKTGTDETGTDETDADVPRPIREVQRNPIATQQSGSVYSYSYRRQEPVMNESTTAKDFGQDTHSSDPLTPQQQPDPESAAEAGASERPN